jgi:hypothetical protein
MNILNNFRKNILYLFLSLPYVLVLYQLLMAIALGSRGYTILLLGQAGAVPILLLVLNYILANNLILKSLGVIILVSIIALLIYGLWFFLS